MTPSVDGAAGPALMETCRSNIHRLLLGRREVIPACFCLEWMEQQARKVKREGAWKEVRVEQEKPSLTRGSGGGARGKDVEQGEVQRQEKEVKEVFDDGERTAG